MNSFNFLKFQTFRRYSLACLVFWCICGSAWGQTLQCALPCAALTNNALSANVPAYFTGTNISFNLSVASFFVQESSSATYLQSNFTPTLPAICTNNTGTQPRMRVQIAKQTTFDVWHGFFPSASECINNNNMISNALVGNMIYNTAQDRQGASGVLTNTSFSINLIGVTTGTYKIIARIGSTVAHSAFQELGTFTVMDLPTAPLSLAFSFQPTYKVVLNWQASTNTVNQYKIERSTNNTTGFVEIGMVQNTVLTFTDTNPTQAKNIFYYRVRASNAAGNSPYSNVVEANLITSIERQASWAGKVFPNPFENKLLIELPENQQDKTSIALSNLQGIRLRNITTEGRQVVLDLHTLPAGVYLLQIQHDKNTFIQKIIKK